MARRNKDVDPEKSKRARGARSKGSRAQREVAKLLGLWFFADSAAFHSTPASGALRWKSDVAKTRGDIVCSADDNFPYSIEIKNQEKGSWDLLSMLLNEGPIIKKWWAQCEEDAIAVDKNPWLIFTRNQVPLISVLRQNSFDGECFDKKYLTHFSKQSFLFDDLSITPLACLLDANHTRNVEHLIEGYFTDPSDQKIFQRHYLNVLKRINC
jgi:hypothetical protein